LNESPRFEGESFLMLSLEEKEIQNVDLNGFKEANTP